MPSEPQIVPLSATPKASLPFQVESLTLDYYRGFSELSVNNWGAMNVLVGVNGSGKSAVLSALAGLLSLLTARMMGGRASNPFTREDLMIGSQSGWIGLSLLDKGRRFWQGSDRIIGGASATLSQVGGPKFYNLALEYRQAMEEGDLASLPIIVLYNVNRVVTEVSPEASDRPEYGQLSAYAGAFRSDRRFQVFFEWFRDREDLENQRKVRGEKRDDPQLKAVRTAIARIMPEYSDLHIDRSPLRMLLKKKKQELNINQLSDGEKTLLAMTGDLARRLAIANPESEDPLEGKGIAMIDEVDLHLHPSWQRRVVKLLPEVFPNLQFFLTTHSAIVASSAPPGSLYVLEGGRIEKKEAFGQDVGLVLDELFGTESRDPDVQKWLDGLFEAITRGEGEDAKTRLGELERLLGTNDPMLVRAQTRMRGLGLG